MSAITICSAQVATGASASVKVRKINSKRTFSVSIAGTATVDLEASLDNSHWVKLRTGITASGGYEDDAPWEYMRSNVTAWTSGAVDVLMGEKE